MSLLIFCADILGSFSFRTHMHIAFISADISTNVPKYLASFIFYFLNFVRGSWSILKGAISILITELHQDV
jgi:hypothetical protein